MPTLKKVAAAAENGQMLINFPRYEVDKIQMDFERFHASHPDVYDELVQVAREQKAAGRQHWGMKAAFEIVRYQRARPYMLSNNFTALYGRLIMQENPDLAGFFRIKERVSARERVQ